MKILQFTYRNFLFFLAIIVLLIVAAAFSVQHVRILGELKAEKENTLREEYDALITGYQLVATSLFENVIEKDQDIARIMYRASFEADEDELGRLRYELYQRLMPFYQKIQTYDFRQLHFHLADVHSFLRFHRPDKFGDDLSEVRATLVRVKESRDFVKGFEEGRIFNGYRFVFPIMYQGKFAGSVEISISMKAIVEALNELFDRSAQFLLSREVMKRKVFPSEQYKYAEWYLSPDYVLDPELPSSGILEEGLTASEQGRVARLVAPPMEAIEIFHSKRLEDLVFLPILNFQSQAVAVLIAQSDNHAYVASWRSFIVTMLLLGSLMVLLVYLACSVHHSYTQLHQMASYDHLTGAYSRHSFFRRLEEDLQRYHRYGIQISLIFFDLDAFKKINDTHGHMVGDQVLSQFSATVKERMRNTDYLGRIGGDEFLLALPGTDLRGAESLAKMIHSKIQASRFPGVGKVECSMGVGEVCTLDTSVEGFIDRIDQGMYQSKREGKNRITCITPPDHFPY